MAFVEECDYVFDDGVAKGFGYGAVTVARQGKTMREASRMDRTMVY